MFLRKSSDLSPNNRRQWFCTPPIHSAFLYEIRIWLGANNIGAIISSTDLLVIPLNRNKNKVGIESADALKMPLFETDNLYRAIKRH